MLRFLPTRAYRPGTPGATTFLSPLSGTFNYGWDSFPEAVVSTPLRWSEVTGRLDIRKHTIKTVPARMKRLKGGDPFVGVLKDRPDLIGALERLAHRTG